MPILPADPYAPLPRALHCRTWAPLTLENHPQPVADSEAGAATGDPMTDDLKRAQKYVIPPKGELDALGQWTFANPQLRFIPGPFFD